MSDLSNKDGEYSQSTGSLVARSTTHLPPMPLISKEEWAERIKECYPEETESKNE